MNKNHAKADNHEFLTINETAALLRITTRSVRRYVTEGKLPAYRVGERWVRVKREDVERLFTPIQHL